MRFFLKTRLSILDVQMESMLKHDTKMMSLHVEWDREVRFMSSNIRPNWGGVTYIRKMFGVLQWWRTDEDRVDLYATCVSEDRSKVGSRA